MAISIIIVNYKTPALLVDCLRTVLTGRETVSMEVIVVDNASGDNSREIVTSAFPQVKWIQLSYTRNCYVCFSPGKMDTVIVQRWFCTRQ
jgi:glycosyltransferase involved in cell wall biosynthesis